MCCSQISPYFGTFPTPFPHIRHSRALCTSWPALILIPVGRNDNKSLIANVSILLLNHFWIKPNFERAMENRTQGQPEFGASRGPRHETMLLSSREEIEIVGIACKAPLGGRPPTVRFPFKKGVLNTKKGWQNPSICYDDLIRNGSSDVTFSKDLPNGRSGRSSFYLDWIRARL